MRSPDMPTLREGMAPETQSEARGNHDQAFSVTC
jgi:hypothetical protein